MRPCVCRGLIGAADHEPDVCLDPAPAGSTAAPNVYQGIPDGHVYRWRQQTQAAAAACEWHKTCALAFRPSTTHAHGNGWLPDQSERVTVSGMPGMHSAA